MKTAVMVAALAMLAGCSKDGSDRTPGTETGKPQTAAERIDRRSQRDLAADIAAAEKLPKDDAASRYEEIRKSWLGKRVTWKLDLVPALCRSADSCHALAFDRLGADRTIVQGWMPRLRLNPPAFAALQARCAAVARCPITITATLSDLTLSLEQPTSLTLADVSTAPPGA